MPDEVVARNQGGDFTPHPEGQHVAICVDVIALGDRVREFGGHKKVVNSMAIVFYAGQERDIDGKSEPWTISQEFNVSMDERANLRKFLEAWRGKSYTNEEADAGVPVHKLCGVPALIQVEHRTSQRGRAYGVIASATKLPEQMQEHATPLAAVTYERPKYWAEKKASYAAEVAQMDQQQNPTEDEGIPF